MRLLLAVCLMLASAAPALAVEHVLVRWKKTGRCEIVTTLPLWGDHWVQLGVYTSKSEAERALALGRKSKTCPPGRSARRLDTPADGRKQAPTYRPIDR